MKNENSNKLSVGIMHKGWYSTTEIDPSKRNQIDRVIEEYLQQVRKDIRVDLQVSYQARDNYYTHENFNVEDFDKAVKFLEGKNQ